MFFKSKHSLGFPTGSETIWAKAGTGTVVDGPLIAWIGPDPFTRFAPTPRAPGTTLQG